MRKIKLLLLMTVCMIFMVLPMSAYAARDVQINEINFPDDNFRAYLLKQGYGSDGVISASEIEKITQIAIMNQNIKTLKGLEFFEKLEYLSCGYTELTELPNLPSSLTTLFCGNNKLTKLPKLPSTLKTLSCSNNQLTELPNLPSSLTYLDYSGNPINKIPNLPVSLMSLYCNDSQLIELPELPSSLTGLFCYNNQLSELPELPSTLSILGCGNNQLTELPELPSSLTGLYCYNNKLTELPELPSSLWGLYCATNKLTELPQLPVSLNELECENNQLGELPKLPSSLKRLYCGENQLSELPELPSGLELFNCSANQLDKLPELPSSLTYVDVRNNYLQTMPELPADKEWDKDACYFSPQKIIAGEFSFCNNSMAELCGKKLQPMQYTFHYEDSWFEKNSNVYNHELAQMSIRTAMAAFNSDTAEANGDNAYYIKALMTKLGYSYDNNSIQYPKPNNWTIGYAIGSKNINEDTSVIMVAVRGGGYQGEWYSNCIVGDTGDHLGFDQASVQVGDGIAAYVNAHSRELKKNVKVWIVGFSRAAAVANLTAADLSNGFINGISSEDVFAYCFACPQGTVDKNATTAKYQNIKNIVNPSDLVPKVAMSDWGFARYGTTYYLPFDGGISNYSSYKADMKAVYDQLLSYNGLGDINTRVDAVFALTAESPGQASVYGDITRELACLTGGRYNYANTLLESNIASLADGLKGDGLSDAEILDAIVPGALGLIVAAAHFDEIMMQFVLVEHIYVSQNPGEQLSGTLEQFGKLSTMGIAHYPELYLAWMDSVDGNYRNHNGKYLKIFVNCPVDVTVFDETNAVVGQIVSDEVVGVENGIPTYIDCDGQKVIILPCDAEYEVELRATDSGTMTYTVEEWDENGHNSSYVKSYYDVKIEEGDTLTGVIPEAVEEVQTKYLLLGTSGETIEPTKEYSGNEVKTYTINVMVDGYGTVSGNTQKYEGEYVITSAITDEGEEFLGWYKDGKLVSMEADYRFRVESDVSLTAKFTRLHKTVIRHAGDDRYETCYKVADELKIVLGVDKFDAVIVATGKEFADALAGSYLAAEKNAPILLTNGKQKNVAELHAYIQKNVKKDGTVYILGGKNVVPESAEAIGGYEVKRLGGKDRYDTNIKILEEAGITGNEILVATGKEFADSLSASATKLPILLVKPNKNLKDAQKKILENVSNIYIIGGENAVSKNYETALKAYGRVKRISGNSRYETSIAIANTFFTNSRSIIATSGKNFPDGLCGGPLAAAMNVSLILTSDKKVELAQKYVYEKNVSQGIVLGGTGVLKDQTVVTIFNLGNADEIIGNQPSHDGINQNPVGNFEYVYGGLHSVDVGGWVSDPDTPEQPVEVQVYVDGVYADTLLANRCCTSNECGCKQYHSFWKEVSFSMPDEKECTISIYALDTTDHTKHLIGEKTVKIYVDTTEPKVTNVTVSDVSEQGYTITCTVTDNTAVGRVRFFTWKAEEGMDFDGRAYPSDWETGAEYLGTINGNQVTFRVNIPENVSGETQLYRTDIYASDIYGRTKYVPVVASLGGEVFAPLKTITYGGHTYAVYGVPAKMCESTVPWSYAKTYAESIGGHLVTITSEEEWQAMMPLLEEARCDVWLGATDEEETGNWKWITGEVFSYSEWETGYPKMDAYYKENYLMVNHATTKWIQERNPLWLEDNNFIVEFEGN